MAGKTEIAPKNKKRNKKIQKVRKKFKTQWEKLKKFKNVRKKCKNWWEKIGKIVGKFQINDGEKSKNCSKKF